MSGIIARVLVILFGVSFGLFNSRDDFATPQSKNGATPPANRRQQRSIERAAEAAAKEDARSLSSYIEKLLTDHLKKKGYLKT